MSNADLIRADEDRLWESLMEMGRIGATPGGGVGRIALTELDRQARDIDLCALLPHAAVRVYVMGERAIRHEKATPEDIARMREISADAIRAGAFGVSTSRTISATVRKSLKRRACAADSTGSGGGG